MDVFVVVGCGVVGVVDGVCRSIIRSCCCLCLVVLLFVVFVFVVVVVVGVDDGVVDCVRCCCS